MSSPDAETASLAVLLWRLDSLDRNVSRLVSLERHAALEDRVGRLEQLHKDDERWKSNLMAGFLISFAGAVLAILTTLIGG